MVPVGLSFRNGHRGFWSVLLFRDSKRRDFFWKSRHRLQLRGGGLHISVITGIRIWLKYWSCFDQVNIGVWIYVRWFRDISRLVGIHKLHTDARRANIPHTNRGRKNLQGIYCYRSIFNTALIFQNGRPWTMAFCTWHQQQRTDCCCWS